MNNKNVDIELIEYIFGDESPYEADWKGDNAFQGLQIIAKYFDPMTENLITYGSHDTMGSVDVNKLIERGITEDDLIKLQKLNWCYDDESENFYCFI